MSVTYNKLLSSLTCSLHGFCGCCFLCRFCCRFSRFWCYSCRMWWCGWNEIFTSHSCIIGCAAKRLTGKNVLKSFTSGFRICKNKLGEGLSPFQGYPVMTDQFTCLFFYLVVWPAILPFMQSVRQSTSLLSPSVRELASQPARSASQWVSHRTVSQLFVRSFVHSFIHSLTHSCIHSCSESVSQSVSQSVWSICLSVSQQGQVASGSVHQSVSPCASQSVSQQPQTDTSGSVSQSVMQPARPAS